MHFEAISEISQSGPVTIRVSGDCMGDDLPHRSHITVSHKSLYWPGDILVLGRGDDRLVSHRFLGYLPGPGGWNVFTKADTEKRPDAPAPLARVIGKVIRIDGKRLDSTFPKRLRAIRHFAGGLLSLSLAWIVRSR